MTNARYRWLKRDAVAVRPLRAAYTCYLIAWREKKPEFYIADFS